MEMRCFGEVGLAEGGAAPEVVEYAMKFPSFAYVRPASVEDAIRHLAEGDGEARVIAGGQSLLPMMAFRLVRPTVLVDIGGIEALKAIAVEGDVISVGALVRWCDIERSRASRRFTLFFPL